eukprot:3099958-Lingulodinium_polyedra.AAC.1
MCIRDSCVTPCAVWRRPRARRLGSPLAPRRICGVPGDAPRLVIQHGADGDILVAPPWTALSVRRRTASS